MNAVPYLTNQNEIYSNSCKYEEQIVMNAETPSRTSSLGFQNDFCKCQSIYERNHNQIQLKCIELYLRTLIHKAIKQKKRNNRSLQIFPLNRTRTNKIALFF